MNPKRLKDKVGQENMKKMTYAELDSGESPISNRNINLKVW